jgi:hypothetical protein
MKLRVSKNAGLQVQAGRAPSRCAPADKAPAWVVVRDGAFRIADRQQAAALRRELEAAHTDAVTFFLWYKNPSGQGQMGILRVLVLAIIAAFLAGCAPPHIPVYETQDGNPTTTSSVLETKDDVPTTTAQPDHAMTAKVNSETKKPKPPAPKPATASTTSHKDAVKLTTKNIGSPEKLEKERAEDERKERHLKQVIEGICRGC